MAGIQRTCCRATVIQRDIRYLRRLSMVTQSIHLFGRVQGVGFRYHVTRMADAFDVAGWVRNCDDGSVEIVATAQEENLRSFREQIELGPKGARVDRVVVTTVDLQKFNGFHVQR